MGRTGLMLLAGLLGACLLAGCGGGGGGAVTPATGSAVFHLEWPTANLAPPVQGQAPAEAQSMRIDMVGVSGASKVAQRPTTEVRFDGLPVGRRQYVATAFDAQQQQLAQAQGVLTIEQAKAASATLSGEVGAVSVLVVAQLQVGDTYQVEKGKTLQLVVCAVTAEGKVVLVAPDSFAWSSDDEAVATVDSTGKVTGVSGGTAQVTATLTTGGSPLTKTVTVLVTEKLDIREYFPLQVGDERWYEGTDWSGTAAYTHCKVESQVQMEGTAVMREYWAYVNLLGVPYDTWYDYLKVGAQGVLRYGDDDDPGTKELRVRPPIIMPALVTLGQVVTGTGDVYVNGTKVGVGSYKITIEDLEDVSVPAAFFPGCLRIRFEYHSIDGDRIYNEWWAKGMGMVRHLGLAGNGAQQQRRLRWAKVGGTETGTKPF